MNDQMTSVADTRPDVDDDLTEISPELVLVDPDLARRLREREPAPVVDDQPAVPLLRLVTVEQPMSPADAEPVEEAAPAFAPEPVVEPAAVSPELERARARTRAAEPEAEPAEPHAPEGSASLRRVVIDVEDLVVPRPAGVDDAAVAPAPPRILAPAAPAVAAPPVGEPSRARRACAACVRASAGRARGTDDHGRTFASAPPGRRPSDRSRRGHRDRPGRRHPRADRRLTATRRRAAVVAGRRRGRTRRGALDRRATKPCRNDGVDLEADKPPRSGRQEDEGPDKACEDAGNDEDQSAATAAAGPEPRRFAWAPAQGAVRYHVELFRGPDRVLALDTKQPVLELGPTWRHEGRVMRLTEGSYRWYVWSVTSSGRNPQAIVQATLSVP